MQRGGEGSVRRRRKRRGVSGYVPARPYACPVTVLTPATHPCSQTCGGLLGRRWNIPLKPRLGACSTRAPAPEAARVSAPELTPARRLRVALLLRGPRRQLLPAEETRALPEPDGDLVGHVGLEAVAAKILGELPRLVDSHAQERQPLAHNLPPLLCWRGSLWQKRMSRRRRRASGRLFCFMRALPSSGTV
jgi:hypothetical protein